MADAGGPACALGIVPRCSTFRGLVALYRSGYPLTTAAPPGGMYIEGDMKLENNKQQTNKEGFPAARPSCRGMPPPPSAAEAAEAEAARRAEKARRAEEATRLEVSEGNLARFFVSRLALELACGADFSQKLMCGAGPSDLWGGPGDRPRPTTQGKPN